MPKSHLIEKYRQLVELEEQRISKATRDRFKNLKNIDTHPSMVLGGQYTQHSFQKESYEYLRQRYYRLKRITPDQIKNATMDYSFDSWFSVFHGFMEFYGIQNTSKALELTNLVSTMSRKEKSKFVELGLNYSLRMEYLDMGKDVRSDTHYTIDHLINRIKEIKNMK